MPTTKSNLLSVSENHAFGPPAPMSVVDMDISESLLADLVLRRLYLQGHSSLSSLSESLKLSWPLVNEIFQKLRQQQLFEVKGIDGSDYRFTLTSAGRALAAERFQVNQYSGPCPVSVQSYNEAVKAQAASVRLDRATLKEALSDLVLGDGLLDQVGPALVSQSSIFLYGPTGNGKTSLAERFLRIYQDTVRIPYAVEVDGQIVVLYDPAIHQRVAPDSRELDPRWVVCRRPSVLVGGELDASMLELQMDESTKIYAAPVQMKANNGILIIDDFGRQVLSPGYLLNRWIVPLDRGVDYLALRYGVKFEIPFEMLVVFATNLNPGDLGDEAFFRRIPNKIRVEPVGPQAFDEIFGRVVADQALPCEQGASEYLRELCHGQGGGSLSACYPRDIVNIVAALHAYEGTSPRVDCRALERAVAVYFTRDGSQAASPATPKLPPRMGGLDHFSCVDHPAAPGPRGAVGGEPAEGADQPFSSEF